VSRADSQDDLSSLVGQDLTPADQQARLEHGVRWRSIRLFLSVGSLILSLSTVMLLLSRSPNEHLGGWLPPALAGTLALGCALCYWRMPRPTGAKPWCC